MLIPAPLPRFEQYKKAEEAEQQEKERQEKEKRDASMPDDVSEVQLQVGLPNKHNYNGSMIRNVEQSLIIDGTAAV